MAEGTVGSRSGRSAAAWATVAVAGVLVDVAVDFVLAFLEPQYSLLRDAESDYGVGKFSWLMDCNFLVRAGLSLALVAALARACQHSLATRWGLWLLGVWPVGSGLLAAFPDDPPGFPVTSAGKLHLLLAGLAFVAIAAATIVLSWQMRSDVQWRGRRDLLAAIAVVAILPLLVLPHSGGVAGLCERVFLGLELVCIVVAATPLLRRSGYVRRDETEPARS